MLIEHMILQKNIVMNLTDVIKACFQTQETRETGQMMFHNSCPCSCTGSNKTRAQNSQSLETPEYHTNTCLRACGIAHALELIKHPNSKYVELVYYP